MTRSCVHDDFSDGRAPPESKTDVTFLDFLYGITYAPPGQRLPLPHPRQNAVAPVRGDGDDHKKKSMTSTGDF